MALTNVIFLENSYNISDQLPLLVPILADFEIYKEEIFEKLLSQIKKNDYSGGADKDFEYWKKPITSVAKKIIKRISEQGVYDLTEYDLVENNPGYQMLHQVCADTMKQMIAALGSAIDDYIKGYQNAYNSAASNITGSGVSVWTNSLANALWYSALEGSVLKKQARQADQEFSESIRKLNNRNDTKREQDEKRIKTGYYYPECRNAIDKMFSYMLEVYLNKLDENNVINLSEIMNYDLKASSEIMKNLNIIPQKKEVLGKAFEKCPYNTSIYASAMDLMILDDASVETMKYLHLDSDVLSYLREKVGTIAKVEDLNTILPKNQYYIHLYALMKGVSDIECRKNMTAKVYSHVIKEYQRILNTLTDKDACIHFSKSIKKPELTKPFVQRLISGIIDEKDFYVLRDSCGYENLLDEICPSEYNGDRDKDSIDKYIVNVVAEKCMPIVRERIQKEQWEESDRKRKEEEEKAKQEELEKQNEAKQKRLKVICVVASFIAVGIGIFIYTCIILPFSYRKKAVALFESGDYENAKVYLIKAGDPSDKIILDKLEEYYLQGDYQKCADLLALAAERTRQSFAEEYTQDITSKAEELLNTNNYEKCRQLMAITSQDVEMDFWYSHADEVLEKGVNLIESGFYEDGKKRISFILSLYNENGDERTLDDSIEFLIERAVEFIENGNTVKADNVINSILEELSPSQIGDENYLIIALAMLEYNESAKYYYYIKQVNDTNTLVNNEYLQLYEKGCKYLENDNLKNANILLSMLYSYMDDEKKEQIVDKLYTLAIKYYDQMDFNEVEKIFKSIKYSDSDKYITAIEIDRCLESERINISNLKLYIDNIDEIESILPEKIIDLYELAIQQLQSSEGCFCTDTHRDFIMVKGFSVFLGSERYVASRELIFNISNNCWEIGGYLASVSKTAHAYNALTDEWSDSGFIYKRTSEKNLPQSFDQYK